MSDRVLSVETPAHGRVVLRERAGATAVVAGFHGYAQSAEDMMAVLRRLPGSEAWTFVSIQALNRFYTRGDQNIVASWMTRQDRETAIADNIEYVNRALDAVAGRLYVLGFSQGVAMAYRAGILGRHSVRGIIAIGGDIPPDVKDVPAARWPNVLIAAGAKDSWYTADKVAADESFLKHHRVSHEIHRSDAGHEVSDEMLATAAAFISNG